MPSSYDLASSLLHEVSGPFFLRPTSCSLQFLIADDSVPTSTRNEHDIVMGIAGSIAEGLLPIAGQVLGGLTGGGSGGSSNNASSGPAPASLLAKAPAASTATGGNAVSKNLATVHTPQTGQAGAHPAGGQPSFETLAQHFPSDIQAMEHASQSGTVTAEEWQAFETFLYSLVTSAHPGNDQSASTALNALHQSLQNAQQGQFDAQTATSTAGKFLQGHIGLGVLAFLEMIDQGHGGLDFSADPEVEQALKSGVQVLSQAPEDFEQYEDHEQGQGGAGGHEQHGSGQGEEGEEQYGQGEEGEEQYGQEEGGEGQYGQGEEGEEPNGQEGEEEGQGGYAQ
ncbi:hypothetical protein LTR10_020808 [Elasticomyces elasticus]|uniref:Uncharacterized protein n=1 Tax=Exophiala sideris TaxID=1016849 RepID=A0ABR0JHQ1_9EURO|nr:hypothetical protein LTR10_020808 [Elasticomyces elasticus]KAK5034090.1 hypothetical protein LTS07_003010 [Exophiala sideris]KAK5042386.1 hypothetical protein LTR13_001233 [Exophiala sideris]KAK5065467.1 hypothetical protein LTR69_003016 [Exophiala sideris]KAK5186073.1 hypothetical protein LTR44_002122 [Eurotiomycetes sp. CCFEE 6388]